MEKAKIIFWLALSVTLLTIGVMAPIVARQNVREQAKAEISAEQYVNESVEACVAAGGDANMCGCVYHGLVAKYGVAETQALDAKGSDARAEAMVAQCNE